MVARLLPREKLVDLLFRAVRGESREKIAEVYDLSLRQVANLIDSHRQQYRHIERLLRVDPTRMVFGVPRKVENTAPHKPRKWPYVTAADTISNTITRTCLKCGKNFLASTKFVRNCRICHGSADYTGGTDFTVTARRGAG